MGLTSDTSTGANAKLCNLAIDRGLIDPHSCNLRKLSKKHREIFGRVKKESSSAENFVEPQQNKSKIVFAKGGGIKKKYKTEVEECQNDNDDSSSVSSYGSEPQNSNQVVSTLDIITDDKEVVEIIEDDNSQLDSEIDLDETQNQITNQYFCDYEVRRNRIQIVINNLKIILDGSDNDLLTDQEILALEQPLHL
jgi:hypothetical protein